jgi:hypothetical protein
MRKKNIEVEVFLIISETNSRFDFIDHLFYPSLYKALYAELQGRVVKNECHQEFIELTGDQSIGTIFQDACAININTV